MRSFKAVLLLGLLLVAIAVLHNPQSDIKAVQFAGTLIVLAIILGFAFALRRFGRWHRGFQHRMRSDGLW